MYNLKNKRNHGITLIALVITIIVLLILAAISLTMLTGDNSILKRAVDAKIKSEESEIKERIQLAYHSALTGGKGSYTKKSLEEELKKEFTSDYSVDDTDDNNWILNAKGQSVVIPSGKKNIVWSLASEIFDDTGTIANKMHIGDYVNYPVYYDNVTIKNPGWKGSAQLQYTGWRVLGIDGEGEDESVVLISAGVPMSFYLYTYKTFPPTFFSDLGNVKLFQTPIKTYGYNTFRSCGFKTDKISENTIDTISDLSNIFNNKYTQNLNDFPRVRTFSRSDITKINGTAEFNQFVTTKNNLLNIPSNKEGEYTIVWLGGGKYWAYIDSNGYLYSGEEHEMGIRLVVYLKSDVKYSLESGSQTANNEKIWNID